MKLARRLVPAATPHRATSPRSAPTPSPTRPRPGTIGIDSFVLPKGARTTTPLTDPAEISRRTSQNTMTFRGGKVLDAPVVQPIYLGQYWSSAAGKADRAYLDGFAGAVVKGQHQALLGQYGVHAGTSQPSVVASGPSMRVTRDDVAKLVLQQVASGAVKDGPQTVHLVMLPPNAVLEAEPGVTSRDGLGGFHGSVIDAKGKPVYFAVVCYSKGQNGIDFDGVARDNISITASHELDEAFTDPDVENGQLGWYNDKYGEIGDLAVNSGLVPLDKAFVKDERGYAVQLEWSNRDGKFLGLQPSTLPPRKPTR